MCRFLEQKKKNKRKEMILLKDCKYWDQTFDITSFKFQSALILLLLFYCLYSELSMTSAISLHAYNFDD